jgi:glycosyltransferase involved in cell wall biosynthesis
MRGRNGHNLAKSHPDIQKAFQRADIVYFPSIQTEALYRQFASRNNFRILHEGMDIPEHLSHNTPRPSPKFKVVLVGSIEPRKGQDVLVDCLDNLEQGILRSSDFYFIGAVLNEAYYADLRKKTSKRDNVHWVGRVSHDETLHYVSEADVLVCASREETFGISVVEGMGLGKPLFRLRSAPSQKSWKTR